MSRVSTVASRVPSSAVADHVVDHDVGAVGPDPRDPAGPGLRDQGRVGVHGAQLAPGAVLGDRRQGPVVVGVDDADAGLDELADLGDARGAVVEVQHPVVPPGQVDDVLHRRDLQRVGLGRSRRVG